MRFNETEVAGRYRAGEQDRGLRLDLFLKNRIPKLTRRRIQEAIQTRVRVAGRVRVRPSMLLIPGDEIVVLKVPPQTGPFGFEAEIIHEDSDLIVVDKPAGVPVHATSRVVSHHLVGWLRQQRGPEVALAHRLDRETSGLVIATRNTNAARVLARAFASGGVRKQYLALVYGSPPEVFEVDLPVGPDSRSAVHIKQAAGVAGGRPALTQFRVERRLQGHTLVSAHPHTGRRHQIRVHLAAAGHPVVGDKLYAKGERHFLNFITSGTAARSLEELGAPRQLLHAWRLEFRHPQDDRPCRFEAPVPADMSDFMGAFHGT